ncbi:xylan 1,4-beta-xylosidase [Mobilitalea sibirica]|uniref:Xylan 1,4-beta-xylosidase n=1 Tax=Mobilitalea sibirica TaxID=1462919 RepID=A0A8J7H218_9FIRM|nr:glycosyl hydrolase [Mobilitalea sibirica]MBH1940694.1 xylan 1,4-beta-xylosidase [Mobilitalea sibirica]
MINKIKCNIAKDTSFPFNNNASFCIGTGRMGLALQKAYHDQLKMVQDEIGFSHIRGHGLFCDDMAIYQQYEENGVVKTEYNFTYLDMVIDDYISLGLKPFVELGFMPHKMASDTQTVFYWKGNVTPPKDYEKWANLIKATLLHWIDRYGLEEVITWPFEVWNEPNLTSFWKNADMQEYFKLYEISAKAVKEVDSRIRIGGPAICGVDDERWLKEFLSYCSKNKLPLDIVTRHAYATELPDRVGHYDYQKLRAPEVFLDELKISREIIDSFPEYKGMEMHITEFNTSYTPKNPIHDTNLNAAYTARLLSEMGDTCASYSYWTFGDIFEEQGVAFTPFSGCFGLVANGMIPKPTFWTFSFFKQLTGSCIARDKNYILTKDENDVIRGIVWNPVEEIHGEADIDLSFQLPLDNGKYVIISKLVDENTCNPLKTWLDIGSPNYPSEKELALIKSCANPLTSTQRKTISDKKLDLSFLLKRNALLYFEVKKIHPQVDRGFQPERIQGAHKLETK